MLDDDTEYTYLPPYNVPPPPPTALQRARTALADAETMYAAAEHENSFLYRSRAEHGLQLAAHYAAVAQAEALTRIAATLERLAMPRPVQTWTYRHHNED